jgi:NADH-quinone oxidoreductase subunit H
VSVAYLFILVRAILPRFRYDKLIELGWKVFLPFTLGYVTCLAILLYLLGGLPFTPEVVLDPAFISQKFFF